jgi:tetratricopeptide (TPR) repeat protein
VALDERCNLEYDAAQKTLESWLAQHPDDLRGLNALATVILHREMFRRGILESHIYGQMGEIFRTGKIPYTPQFQRELFSLLDKAQNLAEARLAKNPNDQDALYWAGVTHATRAIFYFTMAKSYLAALYEATDAKNCHSQLLKINPNYVDAWLVIGVNDYVVGSLPWYWKVLASLAGHHGNRTEGIEEVRRVAAQGHWAREDAKLILTVLTRREKLYPETLQVLQGLVQSYPRNFLLQREIAGVYELQGDLPAAAKVYDSLVAKHENGQPGYEDIPVAKILYEAGRIHARLGDMDTALARFAAAARLPGNDVYIYRAALAAADVETRLKRNSQAIRNYQRVADAVPNTDEGRAARHALIQFHNSESLKGVAAQ